MPFVKKTSIHTSGVQHFVERMRVKNDFGMGEELEVDLSTEKLAPVDSFCLRSQLESGVDLKQQNTKILESTITPENMEVIENTLSAFAKQTKQTKQETKPETKPETKSEIKEVK